MQCLYDELVAWPGADKAPLAGALPPLIHPGKPLGTTHEGRETLIAQALQAGVVIWCSQHMGPPSSENFDWCHNRTGIHISAETFI
jgi:hypothetical protein